MKCERGYNKGNDNPMFGKKHKPETKEKIRLTKLGELNPRWNNNNLSYSGVHLRMKRVLTKSPNCVKCNKETKQLDCHNISGNYTTDKNDWEWLCRKCHMEGDGRILNLKRFKGENI